jgi:glycosyltransferase involved in cell wall biosynthesis
VPSHGREVTGIRGGYLNDLAESTTNAPAPPRAGANAKRKLLVIDVSNSFELIRRRGTEDSVTCRDLDGYFSHVWSIHPVATLTTSEDWTPQCGPPIAYRLNERHVFIEGKVGRFPRLRRLFLLNFLIAQAAMFVSLYRLIRRERISVIRAGDPLYAGLFSWALARLTGIPFVVRIGANYDKIYEATGQVLMPRLFRKRRYEKMAERFVFRRADLVAAANNDYVSFAADNGAPRERITVFPYGNLIDRQHFVEPAERKVDPALFAELGVVRGQFLIYVGRLEPMKHPDDVVRMLGALVRRGHDVKVVMVGEGFEQPALEALARDLGVGDHILFAGSRAQAWLAQMMTCAAAVVSPITGRSLSEAALAGAPIVAYDVDWQKDLIETGVTGELIPYRAWEQLAEGVERFLANPAYARTMGRAVRERALTMLDRDRLDEHERQQYSKLLAGRL